jgi:pimeloyl-ACP methyl ester carboxylesterase
MSDRLPSTDRLPIVFLHGLFGNAGNWDPCIQRLTPRWRAVAPRLPLFDLPAAEATVEGIARSVRSWLDANHLPRVILGGNSLGGHVALHLTVTDPERVAALVLTGSSGLFERSYEPAPRRPSRDWVTARVREVFFEEWDGAGAMVDEVVGVAEDRDKARQLVRIATSTKQNPMRDQLHRIQCPVLLVWGANDQITPPSVAREFQDQLPHAELAFIDRCGHAPMMERPEEFCMHLDRFLMRVGPGTRHPHEGGRLPS